MVLVKMLSPRSLGIQAPFFFKGGKNWILVQPWNSYGPPVVLLEVWPYNIQAGPSGVVGPSCQAGSRTAAPRQQPLAAASRPPPAPEPQDLLDTIQGIGSESCQSAASSGVYVCECEWDLCADQLPRIKRVRWYQVWRRASPWCLCFVLFCVHRLPIWWKRETEFRFIAWQCLYFHKWIQLLCIN